MAVVIDNFVSVEDARAPANGPTNKMICYMM